MQKNDIIKTTATTGILEAAIADVMLTRRNCKGRDDFTKLSSDGEAAYIIKNTFIQSMKRPFFDTPKSVISIQLLSFPQKILLDLH